MDFEKAVKKQKQQDVLFIHKLNKALHLQNHKLLTLDELLTENVTENDYEKWYDLEEARATGN